MKRYQVSCMSAFVLGLVSAVSAHAASVSCTVDLDQGTDDCGSISAIAVQSLTKAIAGQPGTGKALVKVTLDGKSNPGICNYDEAVFQVKTWPNSRGWKVNIGDSSTNDGYGGDSGTQSNDAEMQLVNSSMVVYGNQYKTDGNPLENVTFSNATDLTFNIKDQAIGVTYMNQYRERSSQYLYALNYQNDTEGLINNDIYASFNRTVRYRTDRVGTGVGVVVITLKNASSFQCEELKICRNPGIPYPPCCCDNPFPLPTGCMCP